MACPAANPPIRQRLPSLLQSDRQISRAALWRAVCRDTSRVLPLLAFAALLLAAAQLRASEELEFFETHIRPLLIEHCHECHTSDTPAGGLRLDQRRGLLTGGDSGPAVVPGNASASLLIQAVRREGDIQMPPDSPLPAHQVEALTQWVNAGAAWTEKEATSPAGEAERAPAHWAFQPVKTPIVPSVALPDDLHDWARTPVDAFVLPRLLEAGLRPAPAASRATLIRRAYLTVTGLPPTYDEVVQFVNDPRQDAYELLIDRLLQSPHYGEHWARHWLDVARYSDTKGYVYDREERFYIHAWNYRDWVVKALNSDMPYDRFLVLQLAADQVTDRAPGDLAAMGFLTLGRRFLGVKHDVIDDRIDVVCRGTMGLTVSCARCHDHKYDPIPTADYYSLYGVFDSSMEDRVALTDAAHQDQAFRDGWLERQQKLENKTQEYCKETADRARARIADYLQAQTELDKYPAEGFDQILQPDDLLPAFVRQWEAYLRKTLRQRDPVFAAWHAYAALDPATFADLAADVTRQLQALPQEQLNPLVAAAFVQPPASFQEVIARYAALLRDIDRQWQEHVGRTAADGSCDDLLALSDPAAEQLRCVLYGPGSPCEVPEGTIVTMETFFTTNRCEELWRLQGDVDRWIRAAGKDAPHALILVDRTEPREPRIFRRGNAAQKGREVPRQFLSLLSGPDRKPFAIGSGRLELARAIASHDNPLTARVMVNRVWTHHFGRGLVTTPSDFGTRADPPSHPKLLDWLAARFVASGWSLKELHRTILLSATYRQAGVRDVDTAVRQLAMQSDPENRLLWHMTSRRLTFEQMRDGLLAVTGQLQRSLGGPSQDMFEEPFLRRRALYGLIDRRYLPGTLRTFDFANPDLHIPERSETTVPQQALFFMNHPFLVEQSRRLAELTQDVSDPELRLCHMFRRALLRDPTSQEIAEGLAWLDQACASPAHRGAASEPAMPTQDARDDRAQPGAENSETEKSPEPPPALGPWEQMAQILLCTNEFLFVD